MKAPRVIIGCDPSFAHFGLSIVNLDDKDIKTYDIQTTLGEQNFYNVCIKAKEQVDKVCSIISGYDERKDILASMDTVIGMENALPHAFNATSLTALDVLLFHRFGAPKTAVFNPTYLSYLMGKHVKRDSINLATGLLSIFENHGFKHSLQASKKLTDGEAESFIYVCRMICRTRPDLGVSKDIIKLQPLFIDEKEKFGEEFIY